MGRGQKGGKTTAAMPPPPTAGAPRHRQKDRSNTSRGGLSSATKKELAEVVIDCLEECQKHDVRGRRTYLENFKRAFYSDSSETAADHQKYMTQHFWTTCVLYFKIPSSQPVIRALKYIHDIILSCGTEEDKENFGFEGQLHPMYYYVLKLFLQCHFDERAIVRLRVINIAYEILSKFRDVPPIEGNVDLNRKLVEALCDRLKDKHPPVRAVAGALLKHYVGGDDGALLKRLKYFARFDPNAEVRKSIVASLVDVEAVRTAFFYDFVFDPDVKVRIAGYISLVSRKQTDLTPEESAKAICWGLSRDADGCRRIVVEKLIPKWFEESNNDPIEFLKRLGVAKKPEITATILDAYYKDNFHPTFEKIDLSFLNDDHLIPIEKLSIQSAMFWIYLIFKFGDERYRRDKLLPKPELMFAHLKDIISAIHNEHRLAIDEDRDEDGTLLMCLTYLAAVIFRTGLEEGSRREFEVLLKEIMLDPVLDEAPVIKMCVDSLHQIMGRRAFTDRMMEIFQEVFEPGQRTLMEGSRNQLIIGGSRPNSQNSIRRPPTSAAPTPTVGGNGDPSEDDIDAPINEDEVAGTPMDEEIATGNQAPPPTATSEAEQPQRRQISEKDYLRLKDKLCALALQRVRLGQEKSNAVGKTDFLEAHRLQQEIDKLKFEEKKVKYKMGTSDGSLGGLGDLDMSMVSISSSVQTNRVMNETSDMEMEIDEEADVLTPISVKSNQRTPSFADGRGKSNITGVSRTLQDIPESQEDGGDGSAHQDQEGICIENVLKGVLMMNRYLMWEPKITPFIRQFYSIHAINQFTNPFHDTRTRSELLHFLCLIGMTEPDERRNIMGFVITVLERDTDIAVKAVAFQCMIDLLCHYEIKQLRCPDENGRLHFGVPEAFNDPDKNAVDLQLMFLELIERFANENQEGDMANGVKVSGLIKLLTANRITSESVLADLLCMWVAPCYQGTRIPFDLGIWLPMFVRIASSNARLVTSALVQSTIKLLDIQDKKLKDHALYRSNYMKLVDFVLPYISPANLQPADGDNDNSARNTNFHEEVFWKILDHITKKPKLSYNTELALILPKLRIFGDDGGKALVEESVAVLVKLSVMQSSVFVQIKKLIKNSALAIARQIEDEDASGNLVQMLEAVGQQSARRGRNTSDSEDDGVDENLFTDSDSDGEHNATVVSTSRTTTTGTSSGVTLTSSSGSSGSGTQSQPQPPSQPTPRSCFANLATAVDEGSVIRRSERSRRELQNGSSMSKAGRTSSNATTESDSD